jgi:hypothetical protein
VNLQPRDAIAEMTQGSFHFASGPSRQRLVTFNVMVGVDLDLHNSLLPTIGPAEVELRKFTLCLALFPST